MMAQVAGESRFSLIYRGETVYPHEVPEEDAVTRALYGLGHFPREYQVASGSWRYTPNTCRVDECVETTVKVDRVSVQVCSGCGIVVA
jgi:hypothetical protein